MGRVEESPVNPRGHAIDLFQRAQPLILSDPRLAYQMLISSVITDPGFADGWSLLGAACADLGFLPASCEAYRSALRLPDSSDPGGMTPELRHRCLLQLGHRLTHQTVVSWDTLDEAGDALTSALALDGAFDVQETAFCHTNLSLIAAHHSQPDREMMCAERGFEIHPDPATELGLAFACLFQGQLARGLKHFEARYPHELPSYLSLPWPKWGGGYVETLLVLADQGFGDTLSFARFIPEAASRVTALVFQVQSALVRFMAEALAHIPTVKVVPQDRVLERADAWIAVFSLPAPLGLTDEQIRDAPGLPFKINPVEDTSWKRKDARLHVAIAWAGAPGNGIDHHRSISFVEFLALREVPGIALYSVQIGERGKDLHDQGASAFVRDMTPYIHEVRDTAGILGEMDLVVCCESFVGHLAGALGKWCLLLCSRFGRDFRSSPYLGDRTLWYPETKVIRQGDDASWKPVFRTAIRELSR